MNLKNNNKSGIRGSKISPFGSGSSARGNFSFRQPPLGPEKVQPPLGQEKGQGQGMPFTSSHIRSESDVNIGMKEFDKDVAEAEFLSATAHLSTSELRSRLDIIYLYLPLFLYSVSYKTNCIFFSSSLPQSLPLMSLLLDVF